MANFIPTVKSISSLRHLDVSIIDDDGSLESSESPSHFDSLDVNFAHRGLLELPDLSEFTQTQILCLRRNKIRSIISLPNIPTLKELDLYDNLLETIEPLHDVPNLLTLDLSFNNIRLIENIEMLLQLESLYLIQNKISTIQCLSHLSFLTVLELGANR